MGLFENAMRTLMVAQWRSWSGVTVDKAQFGEAFDCYEAIQRLSRVLPVEQRNPIVKRYFTGVLKESQRFDGGLEAGLRAFWVYYMRLGSSPDGSIDQHDPARVAQLIRGGEADGRSSSTS